MLRSVLIKSSFRISSKSTLNHNVSALYLHEDVDRHRNIDL